MPIVYIPSALRSFVDNQSTVELPGQTVREVLDALVEKYPGVRHHLFTEQGKLRQFVNIFVNEDDIRFLDKEDTVVEAKDQVSIVPSVAGGSDRNGQVQLTHEEILRYSRHLVLPEVAMAGQKKLKAARVLIIGTGGLGSPLALYLAAAGVGHLGLVDFDVVEESNLQRQIIHKTRNVGRSKLDSAREAILDINPNIQVETYEVAFTSDNAMDIAREYDLIIDGTDNFPTRYLVNDVCVLLGKPNVYGSIYRFEGQASVFWAEKGPCYRCLYPEPPPPGMVPSCAEGGVLGILPGVIGVIQATEAVKLILGKGEPLIGRLLLYDALNMKFREVKLRKDPNCPICGPHRRIHQLVDYNAFCGVPGIGDQAVQVEAAYEISPRALAQKLQQEPVFLLDVREPEEWQIGHIEGAVLIPLRQLPERLAEIDGTREIVAYCRSGVRSAEAL
ncbi:MAG: molybdopterin-synthase adenylyltransferase MoeB, partial [Calditrichaeota bacterium]